MILKGPHLRLKKSPPHVGLELRTTRSLDQHLILSYLGSNIPTGNRTAHKAPYYETYFYVFMGKQ